MIKVTIYMANEKQADKYLSRRFDQRRINDNGKKTIFREKWIVLAKNGDDLIRAELKSGLYDLSRANKVA